MSSEQPALQSLHKHPSGVFTRLKKAPSPRQVQQYAELWRVDRELFPEHLMVNLAWVVQLAERGFIERSEARAILEVLRELERGGAENFDYDPNNGDTYFNIESKVIERVGEPIGGKLYTGRSRVDAEPTTKKLYLRRRLLDLGEALTGLVETCFDLAEQHVETVMPGYTGFQAGQPWTFGHFLLSFVDAFGRDFERIQQTYPRANLSLIGGAAGSGSNLPFDRELVAELLGCYGLIENSREWCTWADVLAEIAAVCSILLAHIGQLSHDLLIFCTQEFGMAEIGDDFSSTSSFMPQKKNPNALYVIRSIASGSVGYLPAVLSVMRTSSNDFDVGKHALVEPVLTSASQACYATDYLDAVMKTLDFKVELARERAHLYWTASNDVATLMVQERGLAWRTGHRVTEMFIRLALEEKLTPLTVTGELLDRAAERVIGRPLGLSTDAVRRALDPLEFVRTRQTIGSPNPAESRRMLADRRTRWEANRAWCEARRAELAAARERLDRAIDALAVS